MKVIIITGAGDYAGSCKMGHLYARAFRTAGWNVLFITGDRPADGSRCIADELIKDNFEVVEKSGFYKLRNGRLIREVEEIIRKFASTLVVSIVQVDLKVVGPAARRVGVSYIVSDQTIHNFFGPPPLRWLKRKAFGWELQRAAGVVASSPAVQREAIEKFHCRANRVAVVPNGIDTQDFQRVVAIAQNLPPRRERSLRLLNVARLDPQKGQKVLVEAIAKCIQKGVFCDLLLVGDVTVNSASSVKYAAELRQLITKLEIEDYVHFLSWRTDIAALHRAADIYVHSAFWEGPPLPLAPLEAMASSLPVILTDCVGWPEGFEQHLHGMVVKAGDAGALSGAICWAASLPPDERYNVGRRARDLAVARYDIGRTGKQFVETCEQFLQGSA